MVMQERPRRLRAAVIAAVVVLLLFGTGVIRFYTDVLWFQEVGLTSVLWKSLSTQFLVGLAAGLVVFILLWGNLMLAARMSPIYLIPRMGSPEREDPMEQYRAQIGPYLRWLRPGIALFLAVLAGIGASAGWRVFLLWQNRVDFGTADPQFGMDVGFYMFTLPWYDAVLSFVWFALVMTLLLTAAAHYVQGSIRPEGGLQGVSSGAMAHISVLLGLLALVKAAQYWIGRYQLNFSPRGVVDGASYTDINAQLPALTLLTIISVLSAIIFLVNIRFRRLALPLAAVGIWILVVALAGGAWPWWTQRFSVAPQEPQREEPYIDRNIQATLTAFGLDDVDLRPFAATPTLDEEHLEQNETLLANVRLWDVEVLGRAYTQLQAIRPYYEVSEVDVDRYVIDGEKRQVLLSARELSVQDLPAAQRSWANQHLQFTHGYSLVASLANQTTPAGQPDFLKKDVPGDPSPGAEVLASSQPRIYYGESFASNEYSVVNSEQEEIDYPTETGPARSRYEGEGGIPVRHFGRRIAFAIREGDPNLVLSGLINNDSRIMIYKNVRDRVLRAAPFLSLDRDPYLAVVDDRLVWILDAYTTSPYYPYSQRFDLGGLVGGGEAGALSGTANYIRNSVKVVVDAYDGTIDFHIVEEDDPVVRAWRNVFPALFDAPEPSDDLRAHFRYPQDIFAVQSHVYLTYHIEDPFDFYSQEDAWAIPQNPREGDTEVPPTYLLIQFPGEDEQEFALTRPFTPRARNNMISFMAGRSEPGNYGELVLFQFPRERLVLGPVQVDNLINQDVEISRTLALLDQRGSRVEFGTLINLPIEESILYVQPIYVTAENIGIPELKRVIAVIGERIAFEETFDEALAALFDVDDLPLAEAPEEPEEPEEPPAEEILDLAALISEANDLFNDAQAALQNGDWAAYGRLIERLGQLLQQAENAF
jgi:uncharacterized protein